ncbi:hypothetical protein [Celerinatantimonas sp. MCCC 1A17872]|uniref:hypothetical protein n=1 Tax=Celerinatantimonas sp. MCCC 1A17872 TaxID=3177514 RepID=UPI0038BF2308
MDELLRTLGAIGFTPQDVIMMALFASNWRLNFKMDKRLTRLEIKDNLKEKLAEANHGK